MPFSMKRSLLPALAIAWLAAGAAAQTANPAAGANPANAAAAGPEMADDEDEARPERAAEPLSKEEVEAKVQALRQQLLATSDGETRFRLHYELSGVLARGARITESLKARDDLLEDGSIGAGRRSLTASNLATNYALIGDYPKSQRAVARAKQLAKETRPEEYESLNSDPSYTFLRAEAEIARRSLGRHDLALAKTRERSDLAWANFNDATLSDKRRSAAANELIDNSHLHTLLLVQNNRREEALSYITSLQQRVDTLPDLRATPTQRANMLVSRAIALCSHDDYDAALAAVDAGIAGFQKAGVQEHDVALNIGRRLRLMIALATGRIGAYQDDADRLQRARAANVVLNGSFAAPEADSLFMASRGQWAEAAERVGTVMASNFRRRGPDNVFYKYQVAMQMLYQLNDTAAPVSEAAMERFVARLASVGDEWVDANYRGSYVEDGALARIMDTLVPKSGQAASPSATALSFRVAELLRTSASQGALADGAARLAAADPKLRDLVEQEQKMRFDESTSRRAFATATDRLERLAKQETIDEKAQKRRETDLADKQKAFAASSAKLSDLRRQIASAFPVYRELISPRIPSAAGLGAVLRPGEAYVNFYAGPQNGYAFVVLPGGALQTFRIATSRADARRAIATLRAPFDAGQPPTTAGDAGGFDLAASHAVYKTWIAPLQQALAGVRTVYIATGGVLSNVPWNVLVSQPAVKLEQASWWVSAVTPVQMPSGSSLVLARGHGASKARQAFTGFADPSFDGADTAASTGATRGVRQNAIAPEARTRNFDYRRITPLPETFDEVSAIGSALGADATSLIRGRKASRSQVMQQNLADSRVLAFATHGLLPGEVPGMLKAGLAMSYEGQGLADSVLTIDDIVGLRLDADWVLLSACNTGYASGDAGDSMSALLRGFFASGARTLLATQWAVESQSAKELTVQTFKNLAQDPALGKGQALAATQREMIAGKFGPLWRHPYFWAPYFLAGDAGR
jgi:CHAT domain-containing protein